MNLNEGYIKFQYHSLSSASIVSNLNVQQINFFRSRLIKQNMIGILDGNIGFGNISIRKPLTNKFFITGSSTGHLNYLTNNEIVLVTSFSIEQNSCSYIGTIPPSSESLSHGIIYKVNQSVQAVIHIHHNVLWKKGLNKYPKTPKNAAFGTQAMALSIEEIVRKKVYERKTKGLIIMEGHEDGIIAFGEDLVEAYSEIERLKVLT